VQRRTLFYLGFLLIPTVHAARHSRRLKKKRCAALNRQLRRIQSRLRAGYTAKQGRRLKTQRRALELERHQRRCRTRLVNHPHAAPGTAVRGSPPDA